MAGRKGNFHLCVQCHKGIRNCAVCSGVATNPVPLAQSIGPTGALVAECPALSLVLLTDLGRRASLCKGPRYWVLQCHSVISNNTPVSHPSLLPCLCMCTEGLVVYSWLIKPMLLDSKLHSLLLNISRVAALWWSLNGMTILHPLSDKMILNPRSPE